MNNSIVSVPPTTSSLGSSNIILPENENTLPTNLYTPLILELEENRDQNGLAEVEFTKLKKIADNATVRDLLQKMIVGTLINFILITLARRGIRKDENLVRSIDRIR